VDHFNFPYLIIGTNLLEVVLNVIDQRFGEGREENALVFGELGGEVLCPVHRHHGLAGPGAILIC
jgi:hypothetical protein